MCNEAKGGIIHAHASTHKKESKDKREGGRGNGREGNIHAPMPKNESKDKREGGREGGRKGVSSYKAAPPRRTRVSTKVERDRSFWRKGQKPRRSSK